MMPRLIELLGELGQAFLYAQVLHEVPPHRLQLHASPSSTTCLKLTGFMTCYGSCYGILSKKDSKRAGPRSLSFGTPFSIAFPLRQDHRGFIS